MNNLNLKNQSNADPKYYFFLSEIAYKFQRQDDSIKFLNMALASDIMNGDIGIQFGKAQGTSKAGRLRLLFDKIQLQQKSKVQVFRQIIANIKNLEFQIETLDQYQSRVIQKMKLYIEELTRICEQQLLSWLSVDEDYVKYYKMLADYNRYIAEIDRNEYSISVAELNQNKCFEQCHEIERNSKTYLSLMLNQSVFKQNICKHKEQAISIAKNCRENWDGSAEGLEIIDLIQNNLIDWEHSQILEKENQ